MLIGNVLSEEYSEESRKGYKIGWMGGGGDDLGDGKGGKRDQNKLYEKRFQ